MEGNGRNSKLYVTEGRAYIVNKVTNSDIYLRCRLFRSASCPGRAILPRFENCLKQTIKHVCSKQYKELHIIGLKSKMKRLAEETNETLRDIYEAVVVDPEDRASIEFSDISQAMYVRRIRSRDRPV